MDKSKFVQASPYEVDEGELIGIDPRDIPIADLQQLPGTKSPIKVIRAKCIDCCGGNATEARKCVAVTCPLWPFRMGKNVYYGTNNPAEGVS